MSQTDEPKRPPLTRPRRRRGNTYRTLFVRAVAGLLGLLVFALVVRTYYLFQANRKLSEAIAAVERDDPDWRFESILAKREVIPDEQNSALRIIEVAKLLPPGWPDKPAAPPPPLVGEASAQFFGVNQSLGARLANVAPVRQLDKETAAALRAELTAVQPALAKALPLSDLPKGRYHVEWAADWISTDLTHQQNSRRVAELLKFESARLTQEGKADEALTATHAALNAGGSIGDEPLFITQLIRMADRGVALNCLERALAQGEASPTALARVQKALAAEDAVAETVLWAAARGERAAFFGMLGRIADGQLTVEEIAGMPRPAWHVRAWTWLWFPPVARQNQAYVLDFMTRFVQATRLPFAEQSEELQDLVSELRETTATDRRLMLARLLLGALEKGARWHSQSRARLNCVQAAVAAERFRLDHGRWPDSLEQLVPRYLSEVPKDSFADGPLHYRKEGGLVVVYSVGNSDFRPDDIADMSVDELAQKPHLKYGFRLWDVKQRRQPPEPPSQP